MNEMKNLKEIAQEIVDSYEGKNIDGLGIIELSQLKKDFRSLHALNLELKNKSRYNENIDTSDYDFISDESETLWTLVQKELPVIEEVLARKSSLALSKTTRKREIAFNKKRNKTNMDSLEALLNELKAKRRNAGSEEFKKVYDTPIESLEKSLKDMREFDKNCDKNIKTLENEIEVLRKGGISKDYFILKNHEEEEIRVAEAEKRALVEKANATKKFISDDAFKDGFVDEELRVEEKNPFIADDAFRDGYISDDYQVPDEIDYTKDDAFRYGYLNRTGKFVADDSFKDGYINSDSRYVADDAFKYGYVNEENKFVADDAFKNGYINPQREYVADDAFKFGYINKTGKFVADDAFKNGYINADSRYVADDAFKYGYITKDRKFVADDAFKNGYITDDGEYVADDAFKFGYMNREDKYVADDAFKNGYINEDNRYVTDDAFKYGYLDNGDFVEYKSFVADDAFKDGFPKDDIIPMGTVAGLGIVSPIGNSIPETNNDEEKHTPNFVLVGDDAFKNGNPLVGEEEKKEPNFSLVSDDAFKDGNPTVKDDEEKHTPNFVLVGDDAFKNGNPLAGEEEKKEENSTALVPAGSTALVSGEPVVTEKIVDFPENVEDFPEEEDDDEEVIPVPLPKTKVLGKKSASTKLLAKFSAVVLAAIAVLAAYLNKDTIISKLKNPKIEKAIEEDEMTEEDVEEYANDVAEEIVEETEEEQQPEQPEHQYYPETPISYPNPNPNPSNNNPVEETPAEETPAEETPAEETPAEETPAEETPADLPPAPLPPEEGEILLDIGESAMDLETNVEETFDGTIYDHSEGESNNPAGQNEDIEYNDDGNAIVHEEDLASIPDVPAAPEEVPGTLETAQEDLPAGDFDNLMDSIMSEFDFDVVPEAPSVETPAESASSYDAESGVEMTLTM